MKKIYKIFTVILVLLASAQVAYAQKAFYFGPDATVNENDSVVIRLNEYEGTIQWQKSLDLDVWENIPGAVHDTLLFVSDTTTYFRAQVIAGECDPFYSDTTMVGVHKLNEDVKLIDEDHTVLISDSTELANGIYRFSSEPAGVEIGSVILGQQGEGFMRRVTAIQQEQEEFVLETTQANMEDVFDEFILQDSIVITLDESKTNMHGGKPLPLEVLYLPPGAELKKDRSGIDFSNSVIFEGTIQDEENEDNYIYLKVGINEGYVNFEPLLKREFEYRKFMNIPTRLDRMLLTVGGEIDAAMSIYVESDGQFTYTDRIEIGSFQVPVAVGPVPVTVQLRFYIGFNAFMEAELFATAGFSADYSVEFGGEYIRTDNPQWQIIWERDASFTPHEPEFSFYGHLTTKGFIQPEIALMITGMAGPTFSVDPYLRVLGEVNYPEWYWELGAGVGGHLGFRVGLFGWNILDVNFELFNWDNIIASGTSEIEFDTEVVDVINPATGRTWMDRNLGASRAATSSTDAEAYGHLYQWGRASDGHQLRTSGTTTTLSNSDTPGHGEFIIGMDSPWDWRSPQNDYLWQNENGINNPCPAGYRIPTQLELNAERLSWSSNDAAGAFASPLKLPLGGTREHINGTIEVVDLIGLYWSSSIYGGTYSSHLAFASEGAVIDHNSRAGGFSVRCIKDYEPINYILNLNVTPEGSGQVTGAGEYAEGTTVTITAIPNEGYKFLNWSGDTEHVADANTTNTTVTMPANDINLTANFEENNHGDNIQPGAGVTDIDGNFYPSVIIGNQEWMAENLKSTKYSNGTVIEYPGTNTNAWENNTTGAFAWYDNDIAWKNSYGALYNWHAVNNINGLCPTGWHVPSNSEWTVLVDFLVTQGYPNSNVVNGAGNALKSCRQVFSPLGGECATTEHPRWDSHSINYGMDEFGFSALPGGSRNSIGNYYGFGNSGSWWTSTENSPYDAWYNYIFSAYGEVHTTSVVNKVSGFSVRCVRIID